MGDFPQDIYTEPSNVDVDTLKNLGPLAAMAAVLADLVVTGYLFITYAPLALIPIALTMTMLWKAKEAILIGSFPDSSNPFPRV